jgi:hypothetical protein
MLAGVVVLCQLVLRMYDVAVWEDFVADNIVELSLAVLMSGIIGSLLWRSIPMKVVVVAVGFATIYLLHRYYPTFTI